VIKSLGGQPQLVDTRNNDFELSLNLIKKFLSTKKHFPKIAIINTPNNPTGVEYEQDEVVKVVGWLEENDVIVIADECYSCFSSDPNFTVRLFSKSAIAIDTVSKGYAMPGWRIGWGVMPKEIANAVKLFLDNHIGCPCSISERAALKALGETFIKPYHQQRKMLADWLDQENIPFTRTNGGIYLFPDFSAYTKKVGGSVKLAEIFLEDGVAITPGTAFGNFEGYMRISFCVPPAKLNTALEKMSATIKKI
jgi:aspartate/methionine/tyrosine aminotransferase